MYKLGFSRNDIELVTGESVTAANGTNISVMGRIFLKVKVGNKIQSYPFLVVEGLIHSILGWDAMKAFKISLSHNSSPGKLAQMSEIRIADESKQDTGAIKAKWDYVIQSGRTRRI